MIVNNCTANGISEVCGRAGEWRQSGEPCAAPNYLCDKPTGHCLANDPIYFGHEDASGGTVTQMPDNRLLATQIVPTDDVQVLQIGVLTGSVVPNGATVEFGIYEDDGGEPGAIAYELAQKNLVKNNGNFVNLGNNVYLAADTAYWLAVKLRTPTPVDLFEFTNSSPSALAPSSTSGLPAAFPTALISTTTALGLYVQTQKYWH